MYSERISRLDTDSAYTRRRNLSNLSGDMRMDTDNYDEFERIDEEAELMNFKRGKRKLKAPSNDKTQLGKKGRRLMRKMQMRNNVIPQPPKSIQLNLKTLGRNKSVGRFLASDSAHATISEDLVTGGTSSTTNGH